MRANERQSMSNEAFNSPSSELMIEKHNDLDSNTVSSSQMQDDSSDLIPLCEIVSSGRDRLKLSELRVEPLLFMVLFASSLAGSITTNLLLIKSCEALGYPPENCTNLDSASGSALEQKVQPFVVRLSMYKTIIETPLPALMSLFLGSWSDKYGRRPIILISLTGLFCQYLLFIAFSSLNLSPFYVFLTCCPIIFTGGTMLLFSIIFSHISDSSKGKKRAYRLAFGEACIYLGILCGLSAAPFTFSFLFPYGFEGIYALSSACILLSLIYAIFFVPESVTVQTRNVSLLKSLLDWHHVKDVFQVCFRPQTGYKRLILCLLITASTLNLLTVEGIPTVSYLFTRYKFSWTLKDFTFYGDAALAMLVIGITLGTVIADKWLTEATESFVACFAFLAKMVSFILGGFSPFSWFMYLSSGILALGGVAGPVCRVIICRCVPSSDIGKAFVLLSFLDSLLPMAASTLYSSLYNATIDSIPGAFFFFSAFLAAACFLIFGLISFLHYVSPSSEYSALDNREQQSLPSVNGAMCNHPASD